MMSLRFEVDVLIHGNRVILYAIYSHWRKLKATPF
jgi:hypothetical protein